MSTAHVHNSHSLSRPPRNLHSKLHRRRRSIPHGRTEASHPHLLHSNPTDAVDPSEPLFKPSTIHNGQQETLDLSIRNSSKAPLPRDHTVRCVEARARAFQGWRPDTFIEKLWAQRYGPGGHYVHHYDWSTRGRDGAGRLSSFMAYLGADCTGGGTNFPRLKMPAEPGWCEFVECGGGLAGVTFKPVKGNAVYWENFAPDGAGYEETWHAGLPVESGTKVGLNIWSWHQPGHRPPVEETDEDLQAGSEA